jgi:hypothetical protein
MTGFNSKRKMSQDKLDDDDDTQVYSDTLLLVYQRGFSDGKRSKQRKPLTDELVYKLWDDKYRSWIGGEQFESIARAIERAHNIKEQP